MYRSTAARTASSIREYVHEEFYCSTVYVGTPRFYDRPPYRGSGRLLSTLVSSEFFSWGTFFRRRPCAAVCGGRGTIAVTVLQQQHIQHPIHRPTHHRPCTEKHSSRYSSTAAREYVHSQVAAVSYKDFHVFETPRHIGDRGRLLSTLPACRVWR